MYHLTKEQMESVLAEAKNLDQTGRLYAMILVGWRHGLRRSEIVSLQVRDVDLAGGFITVQRLKGSLRTTQRLFKDEVEILNKLAQGKTAQDWFFPGRAAGTHLSDRMFAYQFEEVCERVGLPAHMRHAHILKHSCGMMLIKTGIENARQYLGHKSISSTGAYLRVSDDAASKAAMEAFA
jgi:type 1 fimbriae regulatory protein FimB